MKKWMMGFAALILLVVATPIAPVASAQPPNRPLKLVLARQSNVDPVEIVKHLGQSCPNITLTTNPQQSDYMLYAGGWSGNYRFMVIAHGGDTIYATETALLSNSVKNVCRFLSTHNY
jgi:hypothetical protein